MTKEFTRPVRKLYTAWLWLVCHIWEK